MSTAALQQDALLPQPVGGTAPGAVLALLVHTGLIAALAFGVDWRTHAPDVVSAELWAAVPQTAAPPPPPAPEPTPVPTPAPQPVPAPPPPTKAEAPAPDITIERERQKAEAAKRKLEAERDKAEADRKKREQLEADKKEKAEKAEKADKLAKTKAEQAAKAAEERLAQQREENLRRMLAQAGSAGAAPAGTATTTAAPSAAYAGLVRNAIRSQLSYPGDLSQITRAAEIEVNAAPGGSIISRKLIKSSGTKDFDDAVLRAIDKAGSLPRNPNGPVPATLIISFRPND
jgi:colicin import membrane protein